MAKTEKANRTTKPLNSPCEPSGEESDAQASPQPYRLAGGAVWLVLATLDACAAVAEVPSEKLEHRQRCHQLFDTPGKKPSSITCSYVQGHSSGKVLGGSSD